MENLEIIKGSKTEIYESLIPQINALIDCEPDLYANLANVVAALKETFNHLWVGFYLVKNNNSRALNESIEKGNVGAHSKDSVLNDSTFKENYSLVLGPFQGPVACTRIAYGRGVCGTAWKHKKTLVVPDVDQFPGHIACSSLSKSEIVVPIFLNHEVVAILDIDSDVTDSYDMIDTYYLEQLASILSQRFL